MTHRTTEQVTAAMLRVIQNSVADRGYPPTIREIGQALRINSSSTILRHLRQLEADGRIKVSREMARAITVIS